MDQPELHKMFSFLEGIRRPTRKKKVSRRAKRVTRDLKLIESSFKTAYERGMSDCQVLILLVLARNEKPMRICELSEQTRKQRQVVHRAIENFMHEEVRVERPSRSFSLVHLRKPGIEALQQLLTMKKF